MTVSANEDRFYRLIEHLPIALWHVDSRAMGAAFDRLKEEGVRDIAAYLEAHPELVEEAKDAVVVTEVNRYALSLFGSADPAAFSRPVRYMFEATPDAAVRVMIAHSEGKRNHIEEMKATAFDGRTLDVLFMVTYPTPPEQMETTFICMLDITDRKRTEAQLRQLQADFAHAARLSTLGELATSIAHEVKQPLAAILTNGETSLRWLDRENPNIDKVRLLTSRVVENAARASEVIGRVQSMASKGAVVRTPVDLNEVVDEALLFVRHDVDAREIRLRLRLDPALPSLSGDRVQLQQVVVNLVLNSIQAISAAESERREIAITTRQTEDRCELTVCDSGPGIAAEHLDHVFSGFFTTKETGIGIGLAICQTIIGAHGGRIEAANASGSGAIFTVRLPAGPELREQALGERTDGPL